MALTVLLDVDGTLVDNSYIHTLAWWRACRDLGVAVKMATVHRLIGMGADQMVPALIGEALPGLDDAHARHYRAHLADVPVLPRASELIAELHRREATVTVATSGGPEDLRVLLAKIPSSALLDHVVSGADVGETKPAPDVAVVAMGASGADPSSAVLVGDTRWDVEAAARAGIPCVAVCTGGWSEQELRAAGAVEVHDDVAALLAGLDDSHIGRRSGWATPRR
ncbi:MAG TPA: HAD family hydrolase [Candidatus Dormibacteraeota bacterium]|jgi:HAD superfamily hydrolase (TIGR01509 family)|nr:HAD family hydrolase [Candidatus Dormibacteraeota bacterium]